MEYRIESWDKLEQIIDFSHLESSKTTDYEECIEIIRLLNFDVGLKLPLLLIKRESPDFEISEIGSPRKIGIEHTWAAHEGWEQSQQYLLNTKDSAFESVSRNWLEDEPAMGKKLGHRIASQQGNSSIWGDKELEDAKAGEVKRAIRKKYETFSKDGFEKYSENWLFISDRSPFCFLDLERFRESLVLDELLSEQGYSRILFMTKLKYNKLNLNTVLFDLSKKGLLLVDGHA